MFPTLDWLVVQTSNENRRGIDQLLMNAPARKSPSIAPILLDWYRRHARRLPWRATSSPYAVWVSEVMLQQTRVEAVIPYYQAWMRLFPSIDALASASEDQVLNAWEGLGYYSRARNLHRAARIILEKYGGELPKDPQALRQLPGIGRYTAGAIASIAFNLDEPTLDGNIRRVFARLFDVSQPADTPTGERRLWALAAEHLPARHAGDYNQALMDLGATICLPQNPRCLICPLQQSCQARALGVQDQRPVMKPPKKPPHFVYAAGVILRQVGDPQQGRSPHHLETLLAKRPSKGLLGGMWEFPNGRVGATSPDKALAAVLKSGYNLKVVSGEALGIIRHAYTHFRVTVHAFYCELEWMPENPSLKWVKLNELEAYPMGKVDRQFAHRLAGRK